MLQEFNGVSTWSIQTDFGAYLTSLPTEYVNMSASELEEWLKSEDSEGAGWTGGGDGETVGEYLQY